MISAEPVPADAPVGRLGRRGLLFVRSRPRLRTLRLVAHAGFVVHAVVLLVRIELGLRRTTLPDLASRLGVRVDTHTPVSPVAVTNWDEVHRTAVRSSRLIAYWPFGDTCLRRCLLIGAILRDREPGLVIGVKRDQSGVIRAHAWLVVDGRALDPTVDEYQVLSSS